MAHRVLITMEDLEVAVPLNASFEDAGHRTSMVSADDNIRSLIKRSGADLIVLTGGLHERMASDIIALAREAGIPTLGAVETEESEPARFAAAVGLTAWVQKPVDSDEFLGLGERVVERRRLQERTGIIGESPAIQEVLVKIEQIAPVTSTVLIEGESGTGKELVAKAIHDLSPRRGQPFIPVNCAALPEGLLESELFGHEKGSFTGAAERRHGRFELAQGGTIFLDEVGEMPASVQVKLLRVLETRSFFRVGGAQPIKVDVRVIAATNRRLREEVQAGNFRDDLYYRLNVLSLYLPPLRERKGDIPILVRRFIREFSETHDREFVGMSPDAMEILVNARWPGNVRELRNLLESMFVLAPGRQIEAHDIPSELMSGNAHLLPMPIPRDTNTRSLEGKEMEFIFHSLLDLKLQIEDLRRQVRSGARADEDDVEVIDMGRASSAVEIGELESGGHEDYIGPLYTEPEPEADTVIYRPGWTMADVEKATIEAVLSETEGNRRQAARQLGIGERTLYRKLKEYGLS